MAKPTDQPAWATDANYTSAPFAGEPTKIEPPAGGLQQQGSVPGQRIAAQGLNWILNLIYQWIVWLDAGAWTAVTLTLTGLLAGVDAVFSGVVEAAEFKHTTALSLKLPAALAFDPIGAHNAKIADRFTCAIASSDPIYFPIPLRFGDRIIGFTLYVKKQTSNAATIAADIVATDSTTGALASETGAPLTFNGNATGFHAMAIAVGVDIAATKQYFLLFTPGNNIAPGPDLVFHAEIAYTRP